MPTATLEKRRWCYLQQPVAFEVASCECGNSETQWSEFEKHLWCSRCEKDFIPAHYGILDGPIPVGAATLMGISFDRLNLETQKVERFDVNVSGFYEMCVG